MYAVTANSFRAIVSPDDLQPGEMAATEIPASTLDALACSEARTARDAALRACDWTVGIDAPLTADQVAAWKAYRQALRDVPEQAGFPSSIDWPATPAT